LLSLSKLRYNYRSVLWAAWALAALLVILLLTLIWSGDTADSTAFMQTLGVVSVLLAAATIAVPILHWAGKRDSPRTHAVHAGGWRVEHCPQCGDSQITHGDDGYSCVKCGAIFEVSFESDS